MSEVPKAGPQPPPAQLVLRRRLCGHSGPVNRARWTKDGNFVLTCGQDKTVKLWNPQRSDLLATPTDGAAEERALQIKSYSGPHGWQVVDVAVTGDNSRFASCGGDRAAFLWDVDSGRVVRRFEGHSQRINAVALNADDSVLLTASYDQTVRCWDLRSRSREPIQTLASFRDSVTSVTTSSHEIVTGCVDGHLRVHDLRTGMCRADRVGHPVTAASLSHDGKCLLGSCLGAVLVLVEKETGELLNTYGGHIHRQYSLDSGFSYSDAHVVSGSEDGRILVWDLVSANVVQSLRGHSRAVVSVATHPKEGRLVSCSNDGTAAFWVGAFS